MTNARKLTAAVQSGDEITVLEELSRRLADAIELSNDARTLGTLSKQIQDAQRRLSELKDAQEKKAGITPNENGTPLEQLAARRKANGQSVPTGMAQVL